MPAILNESNKDVVGRPRGGEKNDFAHNKTVASIIWADVMRSRDKNDTKMSSDVYKRPATSRGMPTAATAAASAAAIVP